MITSVLTPLSLLIGALITAVAWQAGRDRSNPRRLVSALFWSLIASLFLFGDWMPPALAGAIAVLLALIAGAGGLGRGAGPLHAAQRQAQAQRLGHRLFVPALAIPSLTVLALYAFKQVTVAGKPLFEPQHATLYALALACLVSLVLACTITRRGPVQSIDSARSLLEAIGWATVLPLALAALGGVFAEAGVGKLIADLLASVIPVQNALACVLAFALGMVAFTMIMGNAFAAFPVLMAGVGLPLLVHRHGADAASLAALGMLSGYCGTLLTPMAANFNIVPAALLELRDQHAVIRQQVATALSLLAVNIVLMYFIVFR